MKDLDFIQLGGQRHQEPTFSFAEPRVGYRIVKRGDQDPRWLLLIPQLSAVFTASETSRLRQTEV